MVVTSIPVPLWNRHSHSLRSGHALPAEAISDGTISPLGPPMGAKLNEPGHAIFIIYVDNSHKTVDKSFELGKSRSFVRITYHVRTPISGGWFQRFSISPKTLWDGLNNPICCFFLPNLHVEKSSLQSPYIASPWPLLPLHLRSNCQGAIRFPHIPTPY